MSDISQETQIALLTAEVKAMQIAQAATAKDIEALQDERNRALKWGIMSLGGAVMGMAYWIFNQITGGHLK